MAEFKPVSFRCRISSDDKTRVRLGGGSAVVLEQWHDGDITGSTYLSAGAARGLAAAILAAVEAHEAGERRNG